jgi:adenylate kinase family enzyme
VIVVLDQADVILWLDLPFRMTFPRVLRRTLRRLQTRESLWSTNVRLRSKREIERFVWESL